MDLERFARDLERPLRALVYSEYRDWCGLSGVPPAPADRELLADCLRRERLSALRSEVSTASPAVARWLPWHLEQLAVRRRTVAVRRHSDERLAAVRLDRGSEHVRFAWAEPWLARARGHEEQRAVGTWLEAVGATYGECLDELRAARSAARESLGVGSGAEAWAQARGRAAASLVGTSRRLLADTTARFRDAIGRQRESVFPGYAGRPMFYMLPGWLSGAGVQTSLPLADAALVRYVMTSLRLDAVVNSRIELDLEPRPEKRPGGRVFALATGHDVRASWLPQGVLRDYRGLLRTLGASLPAALQEGAGGLGRRFGDPAAEALFGALFERLPCNRGWLERALDRRVEGWLVDLWRLQVWQRLRQLAATVSAASEMPDDPGLPLAIGAAMTEATGFVHPEVPLPWAESWGAAADELRGWVAAATVGDRLATRYGSGWWRNPAAGGLLRDLLAGGPHADVETICRELGAAEPSLDALLETWLPHLPA